MINRLLESRFLKKIMRGFVSTIDNHFGGRGEEDWPQRTWDEQARLDPKDLNLAEHITLDTSLFICMCVCVYIFKFLPQSLQIYVVLDARLYNPEIFTASRLIFYYFTEHLFSRIRCMLTWEWTFSFAVFDW